jgi:hypothetical protein
VVTGDEQQAYAGRSEGRRRAQGAGQQRVPDADQARRVSGPAAR